MSEVGMCVLTRLDDGRLKIEQADPLIDVSADVLDAANLDDMHAIYEDGVLTIHGVDGDVQYRRIRTESFDRATQSLVHRMERIA